MILKPKILKNVKDVEYMDDFDDWYILKKIRQTTQIFRKI